MDPNEALSELRDMIYELTRVKGASSDAGERWYLAAPMIEELANRFEALDGWLTRGGFLPDRRQQERDEHAREMDERGERHRNRFAAF